MINLDFRFLKVFGIEQTVLDNDLLQQSTSRLRSNILSKTTIYLFSKLTKSRIGIIVLQLLYFSLWPSTSVISKVNGMRNDLL